MRIRDWSSDVCSSDLLRQQRPHRHGVRVGQCADEIGSRIVLGPRGVADQDAECGTEVGRVGQGGPGAEMLHPFAVRFEQSHIDRSEEHTSELQSLMRTSSAVFCLKNKTTQLSYLTASYYISFYTCIICMFLISSHI